MIIPTISDRLLRETRDHKANLSLWSKNLSKKDLIASMMGNTTCVSGIVEQDGIKMRERGCNGPCCCTGHCRQLVPLTELDELDYAFYAIKLAYVTQAVELVWDEIQ